MQNNNSKTFNGITPEIFTCIKTKGEHNSPPAVYEPSNGDKGTVTIKTFVGTIKLGFLFDPSAQTLTYTIIEKPGIVPVDRLWDGFAETVESCKSSFAI